MSSYYISTINSVNLAPDMTYYPRGTYFKFATANYGGVAATTIQESDNSMYVCSDPNSYTITADRGAAAGWEQHVFQLVSGTTDTYNILSSQSGKWWSIDNTGVMRASQTASNALAFKLVPIPETVAPNGNYYIQDVTSGLYVVPGPASQYQLQATASGIANAMYWTFQASTLSFMNNATGLSTTATAVGVPLQAIASRAATWEHIYFDLVSGSSNIYYIFPTFRNEFCLTSQDTGLVYVSAANKTAASQYRLVSAS